MEKSNFAALLNSKRDLPKVSVVCIILIGIASTAKIQSANLPPTIYPFIVTGCLTAASALLLWHLKKAYWDEEDWKGFIALVAIAGVAFAPAVAGIWNLEANPPGWKHAAIGFMWTGILLLLAQSFLWMYAHTLLGRSEAALKNRVDFLSAVGLINAATAKNEPQEHKRRTQIRTSNLISDKTKFLRVLVINGRDDLLAEASPIRAAIKDLAKRQTGPWGHKTASQECGIRILILDPFCAFAKDRARSLANAGLSVELAERTYISDFLAVKAELTAMRIPHRIYCNRPMFRMYLGAESNGEQWCVAQTYLRDRHGYETPTMEYRLADGQSRAEDNFITVAGQSFEYMWERGFNGHLEQDLSDPALVMYLAKMYGLPLRRAGDGVPTYEETRRSVAAFAATAFARVTV